MSEVPPGELPNIFPSAPHTQKHLYICVCIAHRIADMHLDLIVVARMAENDDAALVGLFEENKLQHPEPEWAGHACQVTQVGDPLVRMAYEEINLSGGISLPSLMQEPNIVALAPNIVGASLDPFQQMPAPPPVADPGDNPVVAVSSAHPLNFGA